MDLLGGNRKKKWILGSSSALFVLASVSVGVFLLHNSNSSNISVHKKSSSLNKAEVVVPKFTSSNTNTTTTSQHSTTSSSFKESIVTGKYKGFSNHSTYGLLTLSTGKSKDTFAVYTDTPVFNASDGKIVSYTRLKTAKSIKVFSLTSQNGVTPNTDVSLKTAPATAIVINSSNTTVYSQASSVQQNGSTLYLVDSTTKSVYKVLPQTPIYNAITGTSFDKTTLSSGVRFFVKEGTPKGIVKSGSVDLPDSNMNPSYVAKLGAQSSISQQKQRDSNYQSVSQSVLKTYKVVSASKVYVYPSS